MLQTSQALVLVQRPDVCVPATTGRPRLAALFFYSHVVHVHAPLPLLQLVVALAGHHQA